MIRAAAFSYPDTKVTRKPKKQLCTKICDKFSKSCVKRRKQSKKQLKIAEYYGIIYKDIAKRIA